MADRYRLIWVALAVLGVTLADAASREAAAQTCSAMRKINIGVSVAPPNVVHTSPYVAKELGFFATRCIEPTIIQFEGGASATASAAAAQGSAIVSVNDVAIGRGMKVQQFWGLAPRLPQAYVVSPDVKTAADLKGKKLSATGGGARLASASMTRNSSPPPPPAACPVCSLDRATASRCIPRMCIWRRNRSRA